MVNTFLKIENRIRNWLSHHPILYALIVGSGVIIFWRGIWHTMDLFTEVILYWDDPLFVSISDLIAWWDGPLSIVIGAVVLLLSGAFVSSFIGNEVILSGLRGEKRLNQKTEKEVRTETGAIADIQITLEEIKEHLKMHR